MLRDKPLENNLVAFIIGRNVIELCKGGKYKNGNPKRASRFICLSHMGINEIGNGIQRTHQREKGHVKDLYCLQCQSVTKNLEIRFCDWLDEMMEYAEEMHREYYERAV